MKPVPARIPPGHAAIRRTLAAIPWGMVTSYGEIAARSGLPRRARLVGRVLREAPSELQLPWHRVLRADGRLAFAAGSRGFRDQVRRLAEEGVFCRNGRVDLVAHGWGRDLDDLLWGPPSEPSPSSRRNKRTAPLGR
ncbi:MAG: MGMT family protein [Dokdonella sp.]